MNPDQIIQHILDIKTGIARLEEKVGTMSTLEKGMGDMDKRVEKLEHAHSRVHGVLWVLGVGWTILLAWAGGLGEWLFGIHSAAK